MWGFFSWRMKEKASPHTELELCWGPFILYVGISLCAFFASYFRSEKLQNGSSPMFRIIISEFAQNFAPDTFEEFLCFISFYAETIESSPKKTPAVFQCQMPNQIRRKQSQRNSGEQARQRVWTTASPNVYFTAAWRTPAIVKPQGKKKHISINKFAGLSRDWVGAKNVFVLSFLMGMKKYINKIGPQDPGTIP